MDGQGNAAAGVSSSDSGLDEVSGFSTYRGSIDRITAQYDLWQQQQDDLITYHKQYTIASSLVELIGHKLLPPPILGKDAPDGFLSPDTTQKRLTEGDNLIAGLKALRKSSDTETEEKSASLQKLKNQHRDNEDELDSLKARLISEQGSMRIFIFLMFAMLSVSIFFAVFSILLHVLYFTVGTFLILTLFFKLFPERSFLNKNRKLNLGSLFKKTDTSLTMLIDRSSKGGLIDRKVETLASTQKSMLYEISMLELHLEDHVRNSRQAILALERKALDCLHNFSKYLAFARLSAGEIAPRQFQMLRDAQKINLGRSFEYWEYGNSATPRMLARPWHDNAWQSLYQPQIDGKAPDCLRIGRFLLEDIDIKKNLSAKPIEVPAMIPVRAIQDGTGGRLPGHIIIFSNVQTRQVAIQALETLAVRLLSTFPVRKLKGSFVDPIALGDTFPVKGLPKSILSGQQILTRNQDIRNELKALVTHVEQVIQNYLGRNYDTLEDYNADSQSIEEAYRYLFIADFPTAFDQQTSEELKRLITNGSRAGVYSIIHVDIEKEDLRAFNYNLFDQHCTVIYPTDRTYKGEPLFELQMPNGWKRDLVLDRPPTQEIHQHIIQSIIAAEKTIKVETIPFTSLYPKALWQATSHQEIRAPIGLTGARDQIEFWLGENDEKLTVSSGLLAGKPGAGKSYTLHSIILSLAMQYSPDELELYLLDYKEGVEFQVYVDPDRSETTNPSSELDETRALPHAKVISIESDREFGLSVLQAIQQEIETRAQLFKAVGVSELKDYRQKTGKQIPRVLVVIDEFQYMFQDTDAITRELNQLYEDITRRGRSFGVHLLLASQSLNIANINSRIYGFIPLRMAMQMDQSTAGIVLAEGNTDAIELLDRSGRIIYNTEFGRKRQNQLGQIADISLEERRNAMNQIYQQTQAISYERTQPLTIFQGNRPSKISQNGQLLNLAKMQNWLTSSALNKQIIRNQDWIPQETPGVLWLGEAMRIGHHTQAILRRRARSNMLLIGQSEQSIFGILSGALLSLVHVYKPSTAEFHIIDLSQTDDDEALSEMTDTFRESFQNLYPVKLSKRFPDAERDIKRAETVLSELHEELQRRQAIREADPDAMNFGPSIFFVAAIGALNRAPNLRPVAGKRTDEMSPDAQKLQEIATTGPELGIHTILWFDNGKTFQQLCVESPRSLLMQFDCRAVLQLTEEDSRLFLKESIAQNLPTLRAYFYDAGLSTGFQKFKPYAIPSASEIQQYARNLKQRQS